MKNIIKETKTFFSVQQNLLIILFGIEGMLFQYTTSMYQFTTNIYATNLGATDTQLGLNFTIPYFVTLIILIPMGMLSDRLKSSKTVPLIYLFFMAFMYIGFASVPYIATDNKMIFFFIFLALSAGVLAAYTAQWQSFFADYTKETSRNSILTIKNQGVYIVATLIPIIVGSCISKYDNSSDKLRVISIFYYVASLILIIEAIIIIVTPKENGSHEKIITKKMTFQDINNLIKSLVKDKKFMNFFYCILFFYVVWYIDGSMWYISQVQYLNLNESQLGIFNAILFVSQLVSIAFWSKMNRVKSVHFSMIFGAFGLFTTSIYMLICLLIPVNISQPTFMVLGVLMGFPQGAISLCIIQLLLEVCPAKNRSLILNLYTMFVTVCCAIMPLLGVQIYNLCGANKIGIIIYTIIVIVTRGLAFLMFIRRYKKNVK